MLNRNLAFEIFRRNSSCSHFYILDFHILTEISIEGIKMIYANTFTFLPTWIKLVQKMHEKIEIQVLLLEFLLEIWIERISKF